MAASTAIISSTALHCTSRTSGKPRAQPSAKLARVPSRQQGISIESGRQFFTGSAVISLPARRPGTALRAGAITTQAGLIDRFFRVIRSYVNFYGDAVVGSAENPMKMIDQVVNEMQEDLVKMRQVSAQVVASQKLMENKYNTAAKGSEEWYARAQLALRRGDEDLARQALARHKALKESAVTQKAQLDQHSKAYNTLLGNIKAMEAKLNEARSKKETLKARAASAEATVKVNQQLSDTLGGLRFNADDSLAAFARMEEKVLTMEAEAEATAELGMRGVGDDLDRAFALLEVGSVEDELLKMKTDLLAAPKAQTTRTVEVMPAGKTRGIKIEAPGYIEMRVDTSW